MACLEGGVGSGHRCQGCGTTSSFRDILGDRDLGISTGSWGGHGVCCLVGSSQLPARPIEEGGEMSQGGEGRGLGSEPSHCIGSTGASSGVTKTDLAWNMAAVSQACHRSPLPECACVGRSQGQQGTGWNRAVSPKMQFSFFVQPSGGDLGGIMFAALKKAHE